MGLPDEGFLDAKHSVADKNHNANAIYTLRNAALEDLIRTRLAIKELLGGSVRTKNLAKIYKEKAAREIKDFFKDASNFDYSLPQNFDELFLAAPKTRFTDLRKAVEQLNSDDSSLDIRLRKQLVLYLSAVSSWITTLDKSIRFITKDFWQDEKVSDAFFDQFVRAKWRESVKNIENVAELKSDAGRIAVYEEQKRRWIKSRGADKVLAILNANREFLLEEHRILAVELSGKPLYKHIYAALQEQGFPDPMAFDEVKAEDLAKNEVNLPTTFEDRLNTSLGSFSKELERDDGAVTKVYKAVGGRIDQALLANLALNSMAIKHYVSEVDFSDTIDSPLFELTSRPELWEAARDKYAYLNADENMGLDFESAEKHFSEMAAASEKYKTWRNRIAMGTSLALGFAAIYASGDKGRAVLGENAWRWIGFGSGAIALTSSIKNYVEAKDQERASKYLALGSTQYGSLVDHSDKVIMTQDAYRGLIFSSLFFAYNSKFLVTLALETEVVKTTAETLMAVPQTAVDKVASLLPESVTKFESFGPFSSGVWTRVKEWLPVSSDNAAVVAIKTFFEKMTTDPGMIQQQRDSFIMTLIAEYTSRGDKFWDELGFVATDILAGIPITYVLADPEPTFLRQAWKNFKWGLILQSTFNGTQEFLTNPDNRSGWDRFNHVVATGARYGLYSGTSMAVWSNLRLAFLRSVGEGADAIASRTQFRYLKNLLRYNPKHDTVNTPLNTDTFMNFNDALSMFNQWIGGWTYVKGTKFLGIDQTKPTPEKPDELFEVDAMVDAPAYIRLKIDQPPVNYLFGGLR